ncbi:MAG: class I SAM-dependent methyltransferase, partial [Bdellovibrionota bacterium]
NNRDKNFDSTTKDQGLSDDVQKYIELCEVHGGPILELCCGTGRVAIPLARQGFEVTGVDISSGLLEQFKNNLKFESEPVKAKINLIEQDATKLSLENKNFKVIICAFNSLLCITEFEKQLIFLKKAYDHMDEDGILLLDIVNPINLNHKGDSTPKVFYTRKNIHTGNTFSRISMASPFDENQKQELYGWYDEVMEGGRVKRSHYSLYWRPIFRFEIELMLEKVGLKIEKIEGGHLGEKFKNDSPRMFLRIIKKTQ